MKLMIYNRTMIQHEHYLMPDEHKHNGKKEQTRKG